MNLEKSLKEKFCISDRFMEPIILLLSKFELAIPLDKTTFLIPSLLQNTEAPHTFSSRLYCFPRNRAQTLNPAYKRIQTPENSLELSLLGSSSAYSRRRAITECFSTVAHYTVHKQITLNPTGTCFRRIFVADYIPINFWPRLIARFLSSARNFHAIIRDNCAPDIHQENLVQVGDASIGDLICGWSYSKNFIELCLGEGMLLCVNALYSFDRKKKTPISCSASKIDKTHVYTGDADFKELGVNDGFEITVPDYVISSHAKSDSKGLESEHMSAQILSHALETIDEVFKDWFEGLSDQGIYSEKYLKHLIPCPLCYGDKKSPDINVKNPEVEVKKKSSRNLVSFSVKYCLHEARMPNRHIKCPKCGNLSLEDLAPDLVSL